ncbi:FAD:protein FMN transferase [Collinsella sp. AGMB00827]|uniref:FAD:protein FMN transferase n=1 Tax=Collinsella ureilytica TaxID=2869515 RepID=A0ABS7MP26_9ACTN|nr:FAD:protein FMN transferase [Collinsella urealyticum]MBY4798155.1 FAD:protein FMN transferase [Collinsella urealyticum]
MDTVQEETFGLVQTLSVFDTNISLHLMVSDREDLSDQTVYTRLKTALASCVERCQFFEERLSRTRPISDLSRAHREAPKPVEVSHETAELIEAALVYGQKSRGCFDITMGTVSALWDFHTGKIPTSRMLARALEHVGAERVRIERGEGSASSFLAISDPETMLDLGGIAKGYIADDLARLLEAAGVGRFVLDLGGNILVRGGRPAHDPASDAVHTPSSNSKALSGEASSHSLPWKIGIVNPRDPARSRAIVEITEGSVVTSGIHERRCIRGGKIYHHILDPRTGMPASSDVASATIIAQRSLDADGFSTTALMLGSEEARDYIEAMPGIEAVFITKNDTVIWTSGIAGALSLIPTLPTR